MKTNILFLFFVIILLTSGCKGLTNQRVETKTIPSEITGTEGLSMKFLKLPEKIYPGQTFQIPVEIENKGKLKIENAILVISGYNEDYIKITNPRKEGISLEGVSRLAKIGEKSVEIFNVAKTAPPEEDYVANFVVMACYKYTTEASTTVCINPKMLTQSVTQQEGCKEQSYTLSSQGAPIAVTNIESIYSAESDSAEFKITVENKGKGRVRLDEAYSKECIGPALVPNDLGIIKISAYLGGKKINCLTGKLKLEEGKGEISCVAKISQTKGAYTTPLTIILNYGYVDSMNKQIQMAKR